MNIMQTFHNADGESITKWAKERNLEPIQFQEQSVYDSFFTDGRRMRPTRVTTVLFRELKKDESL